MANAGSKGIVLFELNVPYYLEGAPVIITGGALVVDRFSAKKTVRLRLKNITDTKLVSCEVRIRLFDAKGTPYGHYLYYKYDGLNLPRGKEFGMKDSIALPDNNVSSFDVGVSETTFGDFSRWESEQLFSHIDPMESLKVKFNSEEMAKQYAVRYGSDCTYYPTMTSDLWYCTCGAVNHISEAHCYNCGRKVEGLVNVNFKSLKKDKESRLRSEKIAEKAEKEEQKKKRKRRNLILRICLIVFPILLVAALILATVPPFLEHRAAYSSAEALLAEGRYDEAAEAFTGLGNYGDAANRAAMDVPYEKAVYLMDCAQNRDPSALRLLGVTEESLGGEDLSMFLYGKAAEIFVQLGDYKESASRIAAIDAAAEGYREEQRMGAYTAAAALLDDGCFLKARDAFAAMNGYRDSNDYVPECMYRRAASLAEFCKTHNVRHIAMKVSDNAAEKTVISIPGYVLTDLGSDEINALRDIFRNDGVDVVYEDEPGISEGSTGLEFLPICDAAARELEQLSGYKDSDDLKAEVLSAGDFTAEFYALLRNGDLDEAREWLRQYDDDVPEREYVSGWTEIYAPFRRYWKLYSGDNTVIPFSAGLTDGQQLREFSSKVCIEGSEAILCLEHPDGEYVVKLACETGSTDFSLCPDGSNYYYGRINNADHFVFMRYIENGTMITSCEYRG